MKKLLTICILLSITVAGYSQDTICKECPGIMLGKSYASIERTFKNYPDYYMIEVSDTSLVYYNWREDVTKTYTFRRVKGTRYCINCIYTVDCLTGEELIGSHLSNNSWIPINDMQWSFDTPAYDIPLTVTLQYVDGFMAFSYRYIPKRD